MRQLSEPSRLEQLEDCDGSASLSFLYSLRREQFLNGISDFHRTVHGSIKVLVNDHRKTCALKCIYRMFVPCIQFIYTLLQIVVRTLQSRG
jgi:hypothetical protein